MNHSVWVPNISQCVLLWKKRVYFLLFKCTSLDMAFCNVTMLCKTFKLKLYSQVNESLQNVQAVVMVKFS